MQDSTSKIQWEDQTVSPLTHIKVIGVGGGGCNAVDDMVRKGFAGVEFYAINTDFQSLKKSAVPNKIQVGDGVTHGLGTGASPELGERAIREAEDEIRGILEGADMVFITAGMGGGTGTGGAPVIAEIARAMDILCVAIVTKPFTFEGPQRSRRAHQGIAKLRENVDTMIVIMNDKLMETVGPKTPLTEAFKIANTVLAQGIRAISDLVSMPGLINVDFRDVRTIMGQTGGAVMGVGTGKGENRAVEAVKKACHSPLQEKIVIDGARGVLINITGGPDITMHEINEATSMVYETADQEADIIFGVVIDEKMTDEMRVTIIATGFAETADAIPSETVAVRRSRTSLFSQSEPMAIEDEERPRDPGEPNQIPALERKRERVGSAPAPAINFDSDENPLREWDARPGNGGSTTAAPVASPPANGGSTPAAAAPAPSAAAPVFNEAPAPAQSFRPQSQPDTAPEEDPYDIPALQRRRRQRFFE
ncbi:cell division protein FtsZ [bacterium]|nr:cell division protein FtsZ [bacterium]